MRLQLYDVLEKQSFGDSKKVSGHRGLWGRWDEQVEHADFLGQ